MRVGIDRRLLRDICPSLTAERLSAAEVIAVVSMRKLALLAKALVSGESKAFAMGAQRLVAGLLRMSRTATV